MHPTSALATLAAVVALTTAGCSGQLSELSSPASTATSVPSGPATSPSTGSGQGSGQRGPVCKEVRAGIDAFNRQDYDATVRHFEKAVPLARAAEAATGGYAAQQLLAAVQYYAELPAEQYPAAAALSPDFARYKDVTLGQCESADGSGGGSGGGGNDSGNGDDGTVTA